MTDTVGNDLGTYLQMQVKGQTLGRLTQAEEEARRILSDAEAESEALRRENEARVAQNAAAHHHQVLAQARLQARFSLLRRREEFLESLWQEAEARLQAFGQDDTAQGQRARLALIERLLADAADKLGGGEIELQTNTADRALLDAPVPGAGLEGPTALQDIASRLAAHHGVTQVTWAATAASVWGGVIVRHGAELVDNSLNERLAVARRALRDDVYRLLSEG